MQSQEEEKVVMPPPSPAPSPAPASALGIAEIKTEKYGRRIAPLTKAESQSLEESLLRRGFLPHWPIIINENGDILDGHHRYWKCQKHAIVPMFSIHHSDSEDDEELFVLESNLPRRHLTRFQKIKYELERESILAKQAERNMKAGVTLSRNQERVHVDEALADKLRVSKDTIYKERYVLNSELFKESEKFREACETEDKSLNTAYNEVRKAEDDKKPKLSPQEWATFLDGKTDLERFDRFGKGEYQNLKPILYNSYTFIKPDARMGLLDYPGNAAGQIIQNILYYYTKQGDTVVDPMAGGGTTLDACIIMNRRCLAYDISPARPDILQHDISKGFPSQAIGCDAIFIDTPYYNIMKYCKESISHASFEEFMKFVAKLAKDCYTTLKPGGHVAVLIQAIVDGNHGEREEDFKNLPVDYTILFRDAGFKDIQDCGLPFPPEQKPARDVEFAKGRKILLNINRDLIIFKKLVS